MAWWGRGVSAFQEERTRRNLTVPVELSKLSSTFSRNVSCPKHAGTFLERFLQHWRNESCWGPREASRLWRNSWPSSREIFLYGFGSWLHLVGVQGSFPFHHLSITGVDSGWRIVLFSGHWALFVNSILVRWNFVNDDIDVKYCPFGALNKWYLCFFLWCWTPVVGHSSYEHDHAHWPGCVHRNTPSQRYIT